MEVSSSLPTVHPEMLDILASPVIIADGSHKIVKANTRACHLLCTSNQAICELFMQQVFDINPAHFSFNTAMNMTLVARRHTGTHFTAAVSLSKAIFKNLVCFVYSFRDCSKEIANTSDLVRQAIKQEKAEFAKMVTDHCRDAFITCGPDFRIVKASNQVKKLLGYSVEEIEQKRLYDLRQIIVPADRGSFDRAMEAIRTNIPDYLLDHRLGVVQFVARFFHKCDEMMPHEVVQIECVITFENALLPHQRQYFVGAVREISDRINEDKVTIERSIEEIRAKRIGASRFTRFLIETLKTPIERLSELSECVIRQSQTTAEQQQALYNICHCTGLIRRVTNDLGELLSRETGSLLPSAANFTLHEDSFSLSHIIFLSIRQSIKQAMEKKLSITTELSPDLPAEVIGDSCRLLQVLTNLTTNAIKFTTRGHVTVKAKVKAKEEKRVVILFEVTDTGVGIKEADISRLFQSFTQLLPGMAEVKTGSGLGLSICKLFVDKMGGRIGVESIPGRGSTFYFELPFTVPP